MSTEHILAYTRIIDSYTDEYPFLDNYRIVASVSAIFFLLIKAVWKHRHEFDLDGFVHSLITGVGSASCVYLNIYAASSLTGKEEPLRMLQCDEPLTSLHKILPAITLGYSICDIINGLTQNLPGEFLAHGIATFLCILFYYELEIPSVVTQFLTMELSTILLTLVTVEVWGVAIQGLIQLSFALAFFFVRVLTCPYLWFIFLSGYSKQENPCLSSYQIGLVFVSGFFFNVLNAYWFYKIVRKIVRKLTGKQAISNVKVD